MLEFFSDAFLIIVTVYIIMLPVLVIGIVFELGMESEEVKKNK